MATRRDFLKTLGAGAVVTAAPGLSLASTTSNAKFVLVILRGAADGLAIAAPYADRNYRSLRGELALPRPGSDNGLLDLDGFFGLHPGLTFVHSEYRKDSAAIVHAVASPYRERSHFDGQDVLENGGSTVGVLKNGWLNRALEPLGSELGEEAAIALAQNTPLVLRGQQSVTSWAPSRLPDADADFIRRVELLYAEDEFFSMRLAQALEAQNIAGDMTRGRRGGNEAQRLRSNLETAARFLTTPEGPGIAVVEAGGWDTHANQGNANGALANQLQALDDGLSRLHKGMGDAWTNTVVAVVTEFGRTVKVNGTRGTDHGTASAAMLVGGAVKGGRVIADWPGLDQRSLYEGRDLYPTLDLRSVFKSVLIEHFELTPSFVDSRVFPDSAGAKALRGIVRT